jgi:hypothetical protein
MGPANAAKLAPGSLFKTPAPTGAQIHSGITSGCGACHDTNAVWMSMDVYPINPSAKSGVANTQYKGFQTRPKATGSTYAIADASHPSTGDCAQCHSGTTYFSGQDKPANHIPYAATAQCSACHTSGADYSIIPTLANIHANAPSTTTNCAQCHGANVVTGFAIPTANFTIMGPPANHVPLLGVTACEACHVGPGSSVPVLPVPNGAKFSASLMSHSGITSNCVACHGSNITGSSFAGVTKIVVMPPTSPVGLTSHIPSSTACESCHLSTTPAGLIAANAAKLAPGSLFKTPAPTGAQIHSGITSGCNACHDTNAVWMSMDVYPLNPAALTGNAATQYKGFQTRPKTTASTYAIANAGHPATGDCSSCHTGTTYFAADIKPANHIPYALTATCASCHTNPDYSVFPTMTNIHAWAPSTSANCAQCHGATAPSFAIPAAGFTIVGLPTNHIPTTASCEVCHVGSGSSVPTLPVVNGAKFSGSLMNHTGITSNCVACHGSTITVASFVGIARIVVMPPTTPVGVNSHIPSSTACENCHLGTTPVGMGPANALKLAPGSLFKTPAPTTAQIHSGITSGCNACHDTNAVWMSMDVYPISPSAMTGNSATQYVGFQTRPKAAASTYAIADAAHPATGDCSTCHTGTNYFSGAAKPNGHIPTTQACAVCHTVNGDFSIATLASNTVLHTGITSNCIACHSVGTGAGPFAGCATQATCASPPALTYQPKAMPLAAGGSPTAPSTQTHVPTGTVPCESCHSKSVFTNFSGMNMKSNTTAHNAVSGSTCMSCHEAAYKWYGVTIRTAPSITHNGRKAGQDCITSGCHSKSYGGFGAGVRPVLRGALNGLPRRGGLGAELSQAPGALNGGKFAHQGVAQGQCQTCHNKFTATGLPAKHVQTRLSCDSCHRTTAWKPAQFSHQGVQTGQCLSCHNSAAASGRQSGHFVTTRSCDSCHKVVGWIPVTYTHLSPLYQAQADKTTCTACHVTNGEIIPRVLRGNTRPRPVPAPTGK